MKQTGYIVLVMVVLFCAPLQAQKPFVRDLPLLETSTGVNLNALEQDRLGYIWVATDSGLFRYNGQVFTKVKDTVHRQVTAICIAGNDVWVGYSNGAIGNVINGAVSNTKIVGGPISAITSLKTNGCNVLVAGTEEQGVFFIMDHIAVQVNNSNGLSDNSVYSLSVIDHKSILVGTDMGLNEITLQGGKPSVTVCDTRQGLPDDIVTVARKIPGSARYWVGTQQGGVVVYDMVHKAAQTIVAQKWPYGQVNDILPASARRAWVATQGGYLIEVLLDDCGRAVVHPYLYEGKIFKKLLLDKAGNIWCATNHGLTMMTGEYLDGVKPGEPYSLYDVTAMVRDDNGLWIAIKKDLYYLPLKDSVQKMIYTFTAGANITSLFKDRDGGLWVGTFGDGMYHKPRNGKVIRVAAIAELGIDANILSIATTKDRLWVAGLKGVEELSYTTDGKVGMVKHHSKKTGIGSDYVYQLYPDDKGNIWMATDGAGVCMYDGAAYHHWDSSFDVNGKVAYSIAEDANKDMWAGTMYKDLYHFHDNTWQNLRLSETQYPDANIATVMANATGQVISVYQRCVDVWYPKSRYFRHFNSAMGIGLDSTSTVLNCAAKDEEGNIYVPYQQGILVFRDQQQGYDISPNVHITHPMMYTRPVADNRHEFDHDENYIGFAFEGIGYINHERLNYRYTLQGYDDEWIYTNDASVSFPKLAPGIYKFRVQVSLNPAFEHPMEDDYEFSIATPFWETKIFYAVSLLALLLIGYSYIKLRERRLKRISRLQQERMMFEYEHLKSQVNPHFLFNSLYALSILIEEKKENALSYTVHLADLYRNMLTHSKNDVIPLKEELAILNDYIQIQQTRFGDSLRVIIDIPSEVMEQTKIVPLALQLLVENAIKHNVVSVAHPLVIELFCTKEEIVIRNIISPKISKEKGTGIGLVNIKQRYASLTRKPVSYGVSGNEYIVKLPLL